MGGGQAGRTLGKPLGRVVGNPEGNASPLGRAVGNGGSAPGIPGGNTGGGAPPSPAAGPAGPGRPASAPECAGGTATALAGASVGTAALVPAPGATESAGAGWPLSAGRGDSAAAVGDGAGLPDVQVPVAATSATTPAPSNTGRATSAMIGPRDRRGWDAAARPPPMGGAT